MVGRMAAGPRGSGAAPLAGLTKKRNQEGGMKARAGRRSRGVAAQGRASLARLRAGGHEVLDLGAHDDTPSDYPDFAEAVGAAIASGRAERGILVCGSGVGAVGGGQQDAGNPGRAVP